MELLKKISSRLFGSSDQEKEVYKMTVRCSRCGEEIPVRIDLSRELTPRYGEGDAAYHVHKGVLGSGEHRCFQRIDVRLTFDAQKRVISRDISSGTFVSTSDDG